MTSPPLVTVSPTQLAKAALATADMHVMVYRDGGPVQGLPFAKLLAKQIKTDAVKISRAVLYADWAWDPDSVALVIEDPTSSYNGWYRKTGANGAPGWVQFEELAKSVRVAAQAARDQAVTAQVAAEAAAALPAYNARVTRAALRRAALGDTLRPGLVDPADLGWADWEYPADFKYHSDGSLVWPLVKVTPAWREEWALGNIIWRDPADASIWRSVDPARWRDPTRQGTAFTAIYWSWTTGVDALGGGRGLSAALPFKSLAYAWAYAMANPPCRIYCLDKVIGADSQFDTYSGSGYTANLRADQDVSVVAMPDDLSGRTYLTAMREGFGPAQFNFQDMGDGLWMCNEAGIPDPVKMTPDMIDLGCVDIDGSPTPMNYVAGAFADLAAIKAAVPYGGWWVDEAAVPKKQYVRRFDGAVPVPGVNWAYTEFSKNTTISIANGKRAVFDGFVRLGNVPGASLYAWSVYPTVRGVPGPWLNQTGEVWFTRCEAYGASAGGFAFFGVRRGGCVLRIVKHCRADGFNNSWELGYTNVTPGDPNRTREGREVHLLDMHGITESAGVSAFRNQLALSGSSNGVTEHSQTRTTSLSSITVNVDGCPLATVNGARGFHIDPFADRPTIADTLGVPKALIWNDGTSDARAHPDLTVQSVTNVIGGGGAFSLSTWSHAVTNSGTIRQAGWKGQVKVKLTSGTVTNTITGGAL